MPWYFTIKSCLYLQVHCNLLINHSKFVQKLKKYLIIESDLQQSTEESLMNHWMSPEHFMAFYGITLYKNKIFLSLDLLKLIHYFHKFPPLPSWDINHKLYPLLSYRYTFLCHYFPHNYTALEYHREGQSDLHWTEAWHLQFFSGSQLDHSHFHDHQAKWGLLWPFKKDLLKCTEMVLDVWGKLSSPISEFLLISWHSALKVFNFFF